jgi:WD40 repeat protein
VYSVAFAPDGHTLATASSDGTVILWDLTDRARPQPLGQPLTGHTDAVSTVALAPDGHTLTTASSDGTVILWDLTDRARPQPLGQPLLTGHTGPESSVAFAPDGHTLATAIAGDNTVSLWDLKGLNDLRDHAVERACSIIGRGLDRDEWARYVSGLQYQDTCPG